jgi:hypothetical protein
VTCKSSNYKTGDAVQRGADLERVGWAKERCPLVFCELEPGDAIFFHSNLLHTSDQVHVVAIEKDGDEVQSSKFIKCTKLE